jgi:putative NIF3 family GTP cyclohydrolase 1 type 2
MKLIEIYEIAKKEAPKSLSDEYCEKYGAYDNSGIIVNTGEEIDKILFSLDMTNEAVEKAVKIGAKLIITHHPAIYGKISELSVDDTLGEKLIKCIKNGISVISMHLNLDCAKDGIDENLMLAVKKASGA